MMGTMRLSNTGPGTPTPTPSTCSAARPFSCILPCTAAARFFRMCSPALEVSVGTSHFSSSSPVVLNRPILAVVPPRSMPNAYSFMFHLPLFDGQRPQYFACSSIPHLPAKEQCRCGFSCKQTENAVDIWHKCQCSPHGVGQAANAVDLAAHRVAGLQKLRRVTPAGVPVAMMVPAFRVMPWVSS